MRIKGKSISLVKKNVKISDVFEWLGAKVIRNGNRIMAFCPFCEDANSRHPGCSLDDDDGLYHCFVCGASGDTISAVMQHDNLNFKESVEAIAEKFDVPIEYEQSDDPELESVRKRIGAILDFAQNEFVEQRKDPHYREFLDERNIDSETAEKFGLGISLYSEADNVANRIVENFGKDDAVSSGVCYRKDNGDIVLRLKNRITYPIRSGTGAIIAFGGRDLTGKSKAKYKNTPETVAFKKRDTLYGMDTAKRTIRKTGKVIVCEGYMDTIALQSHGFENSVGAMGTALSSKNINYLSHFANTIYVALDSDKAGTNAAMRISGNVPTGCESEIKVLIMPSVECHNDDEIKRVSPSKYSEYIGHGYPIMVPVAKDPDEFFNTAHKTAIDFQKILDNSRDIFLFCAMSIVKDDVEKMDIEISSNVPEASEVSRLKLSAKRNVLKWISTVYDKTNIYQRQNIASYMITRLRLVDTFADLESEWRKASNTGRYRNKQDNDSEQFQKNEMMISSSVTSDEDAVIALLYNDNNASGIPIDKIDDVRDALTSETRRSVFDKLLKSYSQGGNRFEATDSMTKDEKSELARIVIENKDETRDQSDVDNLLHSIMIRSLENKIRIESESISPDVMKIIDMKTKLASLK